MRLKTLYTSEIKKKMMDKYNYKNVHQIPKLEKIVINCVTRDAVTNGKVVDSIMSDLAAISGQKPVVARAKNSIASFKLREGQALGAAVTLRGKRMYEFLDRLISFSLPRVKDFRGLSPKAFDGRGNYSLGVKEQIMFPEVNYDKIDKVRGMGISFVTTANTNEEGRDLLKMFGMPFREK
ncbi:MAG: 50S ribosomal protein L5 [Bacteriovoracaceae bacterium]|jgi:large subunit ribosomal protein L5|nr:50S ribosomal protein L5 [Bacteriovoracaceae bacterium]|tara:strand:- start:213 stop:752 length:540 start_codon:yes stop_codon:yes gene_type:complete